MVGAEKQKPAARSDGLKFPTDSKILNLCQTSPALGAAARNDGAASGGSHPGTETQFTGAWAFFWLPGAFHSFFSSPRRPCGHTWGSSRYRRKSGRSLAGESSFAKPLKPNSNGLKMVLAASDFDAKSEALQFGFLRSPSLIILCIVAAAKWVTFSLDLSTPGDKPMENWPCAPL